jgi:uncharacterized membrane protein (UPF0182 family)
VLQKVVVASPGQVVWGDTLEDALRQLVAGGGAIPGASPTPGVSPTPTATPSATPSTAPTPGASVPANATVQELIALANQHYEAAEQALRDGDLGRYQQELELVGQILQQLAQVAGTPAPSGQ